MMWWRGDVQKLSDSGCVVMEGLTEIDDTWGERNKENRSQRSASVRGVNTWLGWAGQGWEEADWGGATNSIDLDVLTLTCFSSIQVGGLHNAWLIARIQSMQQEDERRVQTHLDKHRIELFTLQKLVNYSLKLCVSLTHIN